jgi:hypothetical protein
MPRHHSDSESVSVSESKTPKFGAKERVNASAPVGKYGIFCCIFVFFASEQNRTEHVLRFFWVKKSLSRRTNKLFSAD